MHANWSVMFVDGFKYHIRISYTNTVFLYILRQNNQTNHNILKATYIRYCTTHHTKESMGSKSKSPHILISALGGGEWSSSHFSYFIFRERISSTIRQEAGWPPEPVWTWWQWKNNHCLWWDQTVQPVAS
jgi:hypothetical protein